MPLSSKRFTISTSVLNSQGFRMLTSGADLEDFKKNPVLLFNHVRPEGNSKDQLLPMGHWPVEHLELQGDAWTGIPFFDDEDEFAMRVFKKVEAGHIRMCSAGAKPLEISEDPDDMLPGQEGPTVTKWSLQEVSICDIGANPESHGVALYGANDKIIKLSDKSQIKHLTKKQTMNKPTTTALEAIKKAAKAKADAAKAVKLAAEKVELALADDTTPDEDKEKLAEENDEVKEMSDEDKDKQIEELKLKLAEAEEKLKKLADDKALADQTDAEDKALSEAKLAQAQGKITLAQVNDIKDLYLANPAGTKKYLAGLKAHAPISRQINTGTATESKDESKLKKLSDKGWDDLFKEEGALEFLKLNAKDVYKAKYKEKFNKDPKNV